MKLLILATPYEAAYIQSSRVLRDNFLAHTVYTNTVSTKSELQILARSVGATHICSSALRNLKLFAPGAAGSQEDNIGTKIDNFICTPDWSQTATKPSGNFMMNHWLTKLRTVPKIKADPMRWQYVEPDNLCEVFAEQQTATAIAVDIETSREGLLTSVAYCALLPNNTTRTYVINVSQPKIEFAFDAIRRLNETTPPKVTQNGRYDCLYFLRFNCPLNNWQYDTAYMMHSIYPELPKDLSFVSAFFLDNYQYWKNESSENLYLYNAKDAHNTLWVFMAQMLYIKSKAPWAMNNYADRFPINYPCLSCEAEGLLTDPVKMEELRVDAEAKKEAARIKLAYLLDTPNFNPGSAPQKIKMFARLGYHAPNARGKKTPSTDKKALLKFSEKSPWYSRLADYCLEYAKHAKASSTYFSIALMNSRLMYKLDPHGTETGRMASSSSSFWCGANVQNIPQYARKMVYSETGYTFVAVDKAQSESFCTAYISEDPTMITAVKDSPDFHCQNASMFFGIPFDKLYDAANSVVLNKIVRTLAKKVNHGANYNMGPSVLLENMGTAAVLEAQRLLNLPASWTLIKVCEHLLACFHSTYKQIKPYYEKVTEEIARTGCISIPGTRFVHRTFLTPWRNKLHLNSVVAHKPQALSVALVNKAFLRIWLELQLGKYNGIMRLKMQVHDEIVSIVKDEYVKEVGQAIADYMVIPTTINGRLMTIPSTIAVGKLWSDAK